MKSRIPLGYSSPAGERIYIPVDHTLCTGRTQQSGKTTTFEAMAHAVDAPVLAFITKRDEHGFRDAVAVPPLYFGRVDWEWVVSILKAGLDHPDIDEGWLIRLCQADGKGKVKWRKPATLADVLDNCNTALRVSDATALHKLRTYLNKVVPTVAGLKPTTKLPQLVKGVNVMDLRDYPLAVQFIIMGNTLEWVYEHGRGMIVLIPEAQKFFPLKSRTPLKAIGERIINERAAAPLFLWLDTQMLRNLDTAMRGQIGVWLFGVQQEVNEAKRTLDHLPDHLPRPTLGQLMQLKRGFFVAAFRQTLVPRMYVQPFFIGDLQAQAIAQGEDTADSVEKIWREKRGSYGTPVREKTAGDADNPASEGGAVIRESALSPTDDRRTSEQVGDVPARAGNDSPADGQGEETDAAPAARPRRPVEPLGADDVTFEPFADCKLVEGDESMYKEKFEALAEIFERFLKPYSDVGANAMREEIARLRGDGQPAAIPAAVDAARPNHGTGLPRPVSTDGGREFLVSDDLWAAIKARAAADPGVLEILASQPEIRVKIERPVLHMDGTTIEGRIAKLIHEGFFKEGVSGNAVIKELARRGVSAAIGTFYNKLNEITEQGFLFCETQGAKKANLYRAVPGMKVTVSE